MGELQNVDQSTRAATAPAQDSINVEAATSAREIQAIVDKSQIIVDALVAAFISAAIIGTMDLALPNDVEVFVSQHQDFTKELLGGALGFVLSSQWASLGRRLLVGRI